MNRRLISTGTKWELANGYSRAVRVGNLVEVAGTTAVDQSGEVVGGQDAYQQAIFIFDKIDKALNVAGAKLSDVIRTRMYVVDKALVEPVARAHGETFGHIRPAATLIVVSALMEPELLVEIEATAVVAE